MQLLFKIGFLPVRFWDILDILIVGYLMYQIYKLLRGSIAFNIFIGVLTLYVVWWLVGLLEMDLLSAVLGQFASVGVFLIVVIFQEEIRRFLLLLGNSTLKQHFNFIRRFIERDLQDDEQRKQQIQVISRAIIQMSKKKTGALIVMAKNITLDGIISSGVTIDATISESLLVSIFNKESPLHDGAVVLNNGKIKAASCILPVSENSKLPKSAGLRHRAAVGVTERLKVAAFIVSEETGRISLAFDGELKRNLGEKRLLENLEEHYY